MIKRKSRAERLRIIFRGLESGHDVAEGGIGIGRHRVDLAPREETPNNVDSEQYVQRDDQPVLEAGAAEADDILARHDDENRGHAQAFGAHQADEESDEPGA